MAIAQVQTNHAVSTASPIVATFGSAPAAGNLLVIVVITNNPGTAGYVTPAGWTPARVENEAALFWKVSNGTETTTNISYSGTMAQRIWSIELSGADTSAPFDTSGYAIYTTGVTSVTPVTDAVAAVADEWAIAMTGMNGVNGGSEAATNGYTLLGTGNNRDVAASRTYVGGSGSLLTTTLSWLSARAGRWIIASFKPAGAAVSKSASDTASGVDTSSLTTPLAAADSGAGIDSVTDRGLAAADIGSGVDTSSLTTPNALTAAESGVGADAVTGRAIAVTDITVGTDAVAGRALPVTDTASGSDQSQVQTLVPGPAFQGGAFQADAFDAVPLGPPVGTIDSTLPALTTAVTVFTPLRGTIASTLPSLTTAVSVITPIRATVASTLPALTTAATGFNAFPNQATISVTLPALTQSVTAGFLSPATISNVLPHLSTDIVAIRGTVTPTTGTVTTTLPKLTTALTAHSGAGAPTIGAAVQVLGAMSMSSTLLVSTPTPPVTPSGVQGLVHIFIKDGASRILPTSLTGGHSEMVGQFRDRSSMVGGFQSATASISPTEYNTHTSIYTVGATWIVKDLALETAGLNPYIFGGELKQPQVAGGVVELAADGWGLLQDRNIERFLVASMALDQWAPGDENPFNFPGGARIKAEVRAARLVFEVKRKTHFTRNDAGQPGTWRSVPLVFWAPKTALRWITFKINATGRSMSQYDLELVGTPTGPTGALTVLQTWNLNNNLADAVKSFQIPAGYDLIGLRVVRSSEAKRAPHVRVTISDVKVGSLATSEPYTLNQAFTALFGMMGASSTTIAANTMNIVPYDAARVPLSDIADDLAIFGQWYWRMWADNAGVMRGEAGPIGATNYDVQLVHTPIRLLPQPRYNVVQFDYAYGGGYTSQETVRANPDPFPGVDITYTLDLPEPPTFVLAQAFAQTIANILSKPWYSGSGTLNKVDPGTKPAGVVKPGDQLTLLNYGSVKVIVDEMSHSEDGSIVEASFAESSKLVDRWLARFQQRINRGLSPNAAIIDLLDIAEPKVPTLSAGFAISQNKEGRKDFDLQANATTVTEDIESVGTYVSRYEFRARPIDAQSGTPIANNKGGGWRNRSMRAPKDGEADETKAVTWEKIHNPHQWAWEVQAWAVDALGQKSNRVSTFPGKPSAFTPVTPGSVSLDVDQRVMTVAHVIPPDPDDPTVEDQSYHHAIIKINDNNSNWNTPLRQDRKVKGESKRFRFHKPIQGTYWAQVTYVDFWGNKSTPVVVSNSKKIPPVPLIGSPTFDANGSRHARYRLRVPVTVNDAGHDDEVRRIMVQLAHKPNNVTPDANDRKVRDYVRVTDDPQDALFRGLPKTHYVFVRAMSIDTDQKESGFSSWVPMGRPKDSGVSVVPPQPSWQAVTGTISVTTPTPRRLVVNWDDPDDDEATRWRVVIKRGVTQVDTIRTRNTRAVYRVPAADVGQAHTAEVYAINDLGVESTVVTGSNTPTPDAGGVGNPPNTPSNPSFVTDGRGSRHAKYRVIVTAGTSTTDASHDAAHAYIIQIAHDATDSGANPPAGAKRQHGRVEGDATGDDLQEVFRSIPKRHYLWVRERAHNAAGASAWTGWRTASRSIDFGVAVAPNPPTGVAVTTPAPRRVKVTWNDPDDDETIRWRVEIRRGGGTVETGFTRSTRYIYHVPKAFVGVIHNARVFAISDTGTDSSQVDSPDGTPTDDAAGYDIGDIIPRGHSAVPGGWLLCNGQLAAISAYPALFALYGTLYGGDGVNTFGVPDIRGRHPVGVGTNVALGGDEGDAEVNRSPVHQHSQDNTNATPGSDNSQTTPGSDSTYAGGEAGDLFTNPPDDATLETVTHTHGLGMNTGSPGATTAVNGTGGANVAGPAHTHNVPGPTDVRNAQHPHQHGATHGHGHNHGHPQHPHPHGHGGHGHNHGHGQHPHPHPHDQKKRPHKGMHWIVKAA
jgi:microcystin-dependent protein